LVLALYLNTYAQVDQKKLDSLSRLIDSTAHAYRMQQDSVIHFQDSTYQSEVNKSLQSSRNPDQFVAEQKRREAKERQQAILRIGISAALLIIAIIVLLRRRKTKS